MEQKLKIQKSILRKRKIKYYIVNQSNDESDRESDASTDENEIETNTNDNDDNDYDYDKTIKKKRNKTKIIKKSKASHQQPKKKEILDKKPQNRRE